MLIDKISLKIWTETEPVLWIPFCLNVLRKSFQESDNFKLEKNKTSAKALLFVLIDDELNYYVLSNKNFDSIDQSLPLTEWLEHILSKNWT